MQILSRARLHDVIPALHWRANAAFERAYVEVTAVRRRLLRQATFVGVTGSAGKTTTKELIVAMLSRERRGRGSYITENRPYQVARLLWQMPSNDEFCVCELTATTPGLIDQSIELVRPSIGVVTTIGDDHISAFGSRAAIAREKGKLVAALPPNGTAVLNADDPLVMGMGERTAARVMTYGLCEGADVRGMDVSGAWPGRLRMRVRAGSEESELQTQLLGAHWTHCALAAIATGLSMGITLQRCTEALASAPPFLARMEPVLSKDGVMFIRDDWKAPLWTTDASFAFMQQAQARRKIIVIGTLSDYGGDASAQYGRVARRALEAADHVVFVGDWASRALRAVRGKDGASLRAFTHVRHASEHLNAMLAPGDLVLLKGTNRKDHLLRMLLARDGAVLCWRDDCGKQTFCDRCASLAVPCGPASRPPEQAPEVPTPNAGPRAQAVIGLGNPGARFAGTPHNVGHAVVECIAVRLGAQWNEIGSALVARGTWHEHAIVLVKLQVGVNSSGSTLRDMAARLAFDMADSVLVHDDLDLPIGSVRARMSGSAGGHRGVASVLDACQSDAVRRVKVGVGRPDAGSRVADYVLQPFPQESRAAVELACETAAQRVLDLIGARTRAKHTMAAEPGRVS